MTAPPQLLCPLCGSNAFRVQDAPQRIYWKALVQRMTLVICQRCHHVLHFYDRDGIFDLG